MYGQLFSEGKLSNRRWLTLWCKLIMEYLYIELIVEYLYIELTVEHFSYRINGRSNIYFNKRAVLKQIMFNFIAILRDYVIENTLMNVKHFLAYCKLWWIYVYTYCDVKIAFSCVY